MEVVADIEAYPKGAEEILSPTRTAENRMISARTGRHRPSERLVLMAYMEGAAFRRDHPEYEPAPKGL